MKRITALILCIVLVFSLVATAGAYSFRGNGTATQKATAYRLPSVNSGDVWWVDKNDKLEVFCKDGAFYLVLYPFNNTGKHVLAYVPTSAVSASGVPNAAVFYENKSVTAKTNANLYHNPSTDKLTGASGSNQAVRATVSKGQELTLLFEKDGFYCVRTSNDTGFIEKSKICNHSSVSNKDVSSTAININDKTYHEVKTSYNEVCNDCGLVIKKNASKSEEKKHSLSGNICADCGWSAPATEKEECKHSNTTKHMSEEKEASYTQKDDTHHSVTMYYHLYCTNCYTYTEKNLSEKYNEEHSFSGNKCIDCGFQKASGKSAWVCNTNGAALKIHRVAALGNTIRGEIPTGAKLTVFGEKTNGFYRVEYNDIVGYAQAEYITFTEPTIAKAAYVYNTSGKLLNIRSEANKTSSVVITIAEGSSVTVTGDIINGFYPVNCEGKSGYAQADYITFKKETNGKTAWVSYAVTSDLDIHRLPAIGKTIRGEIPAGAQLTVFGEKTNGFYRVEYNGVSGYAQAKYIVFNKPTEGKKAWVCNTNGAPLEVHRTSALGNTIRGEIPAKAEITVTGNKTNGFYKVTYEDIVGYVQAEYVTFTKPPEGKSAWVYNTLGESLKIHRQAALGNTTRGDIPFGHEFTVTGDRTNGFYPVYYNGITGYVEAKYVTYDKSKAFGSIIVNEKTEKKKAELTAMMNGSAYNGSCKVGISYRGRYADQQCKGFAKYVFLQLFSVSIGSTKENDYEINYDNKTTIHLGTLENLSKSDANEVKALFMRSRPGDFVQMRQNLTTYKGPHSAIVYEVTPQGVTMYEANVPNNNMIAMNTYSWSEICTEKKHISLYTAKGY